MYPFHLWKVLRQDEAASTFQRLWTSRHVADLQLIFYCSCSLMVLGSAFAFIWHKWVDSYGVIGSATLISAIVGTGCGILSWCYLTGSCRLGIVDLFACEIKTICTVTGITETVPHLVAVHDNPPLEAMPFTSEEDYSPVFDSKSKDLEVLEARVVGPVTEFYTYLKTARDYLRLLSAIKQPRIELNRWNDSIKNVVYMLFLMLESARSAIDSLIEFEPEQAEAEIIILLSELVAYRFLLRRYEKDVHADYDARLERLRLRTHFYSDIVSDVYDRTNRYKDIPGTDQRAWERAAALLGELNQIYWEAFGKKIEEAGTKCLNELAGNSEPRVKDSAEL